MTPDAGRPALRLDAGHRRQLRRPRAEAPAPRRGGGRPVPGLLVLHRLDDVKSRAALAILEILFALQESDGKSVGPLLTLPLGG